MLALAKAKSRVALFMCAIFCTFLGLAVVSALGLRASDATLVAPDHQLDVLLSCTEFAYGFDSSSRTLLEFDVERKSIRGTYKVHTPDRDLIDFSSTILRDASHLAIGTTSGYFAGEPGSGTIEFFPFDTTNTLLCGLQDGHVYLVEGSAVIEVSLREEGRRSVYTFDEPFELQACLHAPDSAVIVCISRDLYRICFKDDLLVKAVDKIDIRERSRLEYTGGYLFENRSDGLAVSYKWDPMKPGFVLHESRMIHVVETADAVGQRGESLLVARGNSKTGLVVIEDWDTGRVFKNIRVRQGDRVDLLAFVQDHDVVLIPTRQGSPRVLRLQVDE